MSLFICSKCGHVENTNLINGPIDKKKWPDKATEEFPCYCLQDMLSVPEGEPSKMLCCLCNTGTHHGEFERVLPSNEEKLYASYSKFNMITLYDHPKDLFTNDPTSYYSLRMLTEEEREKRKKGKAALRGMMGLGVMFGHNFGKFTQSCGKTDQSDDEKRCYLKIAEYKRNLKVAKKAKRQDEVISLEGLINQTQDLLLRVTADKKG